MYCSARTALQGSITLMQEIARYRNASSVHEFIDSSSTIVESDHSYTTSSKLFGTLDGITRFAGAHRRMILDAFKAVLILLPAAVNQERA